MDITDTHKKYLLSYIYEEIEKRYYHAKHSNNAEKIEKYSQWLKELDQKQISSNELILVLKNMQDIYSNRIYDMPTFIELLLKGHWAKDTALNGFIKDYPRLF